MVHAFWWVFLRAFAEVVDSAIASRVDSPDTRTCTESPSYLENPLHSQAGNTVNCRVRAVMRSVSILSSLSLVA